MRIKDSKYISYAGKPVKEAWYEGTLVWQISSWDPSNIPTVFWYDPSDSSTITTSGSTVTQVTDKSGNGYTLSVITAGKAGPTIGTRTLNGLNVFEYDLAIPNNQILENNSFAHDQATTPLNLAVIVRCDNESISDQDFIFAGTETTGTRLAARRTTTNQVQILGTTNIETAVGTAPEDSNLLIIAKFNAANSAIRLNGTQLALGNIGTNSFTSLNFGANENEDQAVEGFIAEVVAFSDNSKQEIVEGYLAWKWDLVANLPANHPYKNIKPVV